MNEELLRLWRHEMEWGTQHLGERQYEEAESRFLLGTKLARETLVPEVIAFSLRLLATVRARLGKYEMAEEGFKEALNLCQQVRNAKGISEALAGLAGVAVSRGDLTPAREAFEKAIKIYPPSSPPLRLAMLYSDLGQVYGNLEDWRKAEDAYNKARELCQIYDYPRGVAELYVLTGEVYFRQGNPRLALNQLERACQIFGRIKEWEHLTHALQYVAFLNYELGNIPQAQVSQQRALTLGLKTKNREENSESSYFLSRIEQELGNMDEALYYLQLSIELYPHQDTGLAARYQILGRMAAAQKDYSLAERAYLKALDYFRIMEDGQKQNEIYDALAQLLQRQGREEEAREYAPETQMENGMIAMEGFQRLGAMYEKKQEAMMALQCYWKALELAKIYSIDEEGIEKAIQRVSQKVRRKRKK